MSKIIFIAMACFSAFSTAAFETSHLPLADEIAKTFPKIMSKCYVIVNEETGNVVTEENAQKEIETGTFVQIYGGADVMTLLEMSELVKRCELRFFRSDMSGIGCAYKYKNKSGATFICVIYGEQSEDDAQSDMNKINAWLEQFYVHKVTASQNTLRIPVLYGKRDFIDVNFSNVISILCSKNLPRPKYIDVVFRYRTIMRAPMYKGDEIGQIIYSTSIFKRPILRPINALTGMQTIVWYKRIWDTVTYLIYGARKKH